MHHISREITVVPDDNGDIIIRDCAPPLSAMHTDYEYHYREQQIRSFAVNTMRYVDVLVAYQFWIHNSVRSCSAGEKYVIKLMLSQ